MNVQEIVQQAHAELCAEQTREAIDAMKIKLKKRKWWHKFFPVKISITRMKNV
jgi:hypothetical protein